MSTKFAGVAGNPIAHSLSPQIHLAGYKELGIDWDYKKFELDQAGLVEFVKNRDPELVGLSLTMPLKEIPFQFADTITQTAQEVKSINTLLFKEGKVLAGNTDIYGIVMALRTNKNLDISKPAVIGSGATARSALSALKELGAGQIQICARNPEKIQEMNLIATNLGLELEIIDWKNIHQALAATTVISTLPSGGMDTFADRGPEIPGSLLDVSYNPWPSKLALEWILRRGFVVSGLEMLLHQAIRQFELMTGKKAPLKQMRESIFKN